MKYNFFSKTLVSRFKPISLIRVFRIRTFWFSSSWRNQTAWCWSDHWWCLNWSDSGIWGDSSGWFCHPFFLFYHSLGSSTDYKMRQKFKLRVMSRFRSIYNHSVNRGKTIFPFSFWWLNIFGSKKVIISIWLFRTFSTNFLERNFL